ncbi:hypothetical protein FNH05_31360 [Amycolatopsis rhizosphaerae]|uniref:Uncharacterized protein n=1 Tax=Amycolatopsis rhizosphaerae TaxID=2053003 RepID=A0A558AQH9_9PSEU|nr:hypothetical protein [Amycolatopsis rhizosphaerae]TVT26500.1 hypothetical protein FNH05_31360 [Amycolatopsis rhizosphaerae]
MGGGSVDGFVEQDWFEFYEETVEVYPTSEPGHSFLAGLRARAVARAWPIAADDTFAYQPVDDERLLRAGVWLDDPETQNAVLTAVVEFDGTQIVGGLAWHEAPFDFPVAEAEVVYSGTVEVLVDRAGEWFESVLSRPIERREWFDNGIQVAREWVLADTERPLVISGRLRLARPPDRVTLVRGVRRPEHEGRPRGRWWDFGKRRGRQGE